MPWPTFYGVIGKTGDDICPMSALLSYLVLRGNKPGPLFQWENGSPYQNQNL